MKKILLSLSLLISGYIFILYVTNKQLKPQSIYTDYKLSIGKISKEEIDYSTIKNINYKNNYIKTLYCDDIKVKIFGEKNFKLKAILAYEKPNKIRIKFYSVLGEEMDIGSDSHKFWFWSKHSTKPGLYWSTYENLPKSNLKLEFDPIWLIQTLGIDEINYKNCIMDKTGDKIRIIKQKSDNYFVTNLSQNGNIIGLATYDKSGILIAGSEIQEYYDNMPYQIYYNWNRENIQMTWQLNNLKINIPIQSSNWEFPNKTPKIDMSKD